MTGRLRKSLYMYGTNQRCNMAIWDASYAWGHNFVESDRQKITLYINRSFLPQIQDSLSFSGKSGTNPGEKHTTTDIGPCYLHYLRKSSNETQYNIDISSGPIKMWIKLIDLYRFPLSPHIWWNLHRTVWAGLLNRLNWKYLLHVMEHAAWAEIRIGFNVCIIVKVVASESNAKE